MKRVLSVLFIGLVLGLVGPARNAHAYIDPGAGSFLFQILVAVFFATLFVLKSWWIRLGHVIGNLFGRNRKPHN